MRIGILTDILVSDPWSGVGTYVRALVREWSRAHEVWSIGTEGPPAGAGLAGHLRVRWWNWGWRGQVESLTDVVHCPLGWVPDYFYNLSRPKVVTVHGAAAFIFAGNPQAIEPSPRPAQVRLRERRDKVDLFLTVSRSAQKEVAEHYGVAAERVLPIYHGIDQESFFPPADKATARQRACARFGISGPYLLHISNYRPKKNGARIVAAFRRLREQGFRDLALVLAGAVHVGFDAVREEMGRLPGGTVVELGPVHGRELTELYQGAEVFLFPSLHESFGLPALESLACGVPAVVSNVFSQPEVTGGAGVEVNPESVEEIAQATARLLREAAYYAERQRAGLQRSREFRWDVCAQKHLEAFERARQLFQARPPAGR